MNDESSRGHAVLLMQTCIRRNAISDTSVLDAGSPRDTRKHSRAIFSRLTIADLAGSEDQKLQHGWREGHREEVYTAKSDFGPGAAGPAG